MKRTSGLIALALIPILQSHAATIALWTFESPNVPPTTTGTSITGLLPNVGSGVASSVHSSALTTFSTATGNGSAHALTANYCLAGDYLQFQVSTLGFNQIQFGLDQFGSWAGVTNITLAYSLDGSSFSTLADNVPLLFTMEVQQPWDPNTRDLAYNTSFDLSTVAELENQPLIYFRVSSNTGFPANSFGTWTVDNVSVTGVAVPEPENLYALPVLLLALRLWLRSRFQVVNC